MRCPKCGYTSFDYLDSCKKCGNDLVAFKAKHGLRSLLFPVNRADQGVASPTESAELPNEIPAVEAAAATDFGYDFMDEPPAEAAPDAPPPEVAAPSAFEEGVPAAEPAPIDFGYDFMGEPATDDSPVPEGEPAAPAAEANPVTDDLLLPDDFSLDFGEAEETPPAAGDEPLFDTADTDGELPPLGEPDDFSFFDDEEDPAELAADEDLLAWENEEDQAPVRKQPPDKEGPSDPFEQREPATAGQVPAILPGLTAAPEFPFDIPEEVETLSGLLEEGWLESRPPAAVAEELPEVTPAAELAEAELEANADESPEMAQVALPGGCPERSAGMEPAPDAAPAESADVWLVTEAEPEEAEILAVEELPQEDGSQPLLAEAAAAAEDGDGAAESADAEEAAPLVRRLAAFLADLLVLGSVQGAFLLLGQHLLAPRALDLFPDPTLLLRLSTPYFLLLFLTCFGYFTLFHFLFGQTPGKILFGLGVEAMDGARLTPAQAFLRSVGGLAALSLAGLGYAVILFDAEGRGWNDRMAGTRVVNWGEEPDATEVEDKEE